MDRVLPSTTLGTPMRPARNEELVRYRLELHGRCFVAEVVRAV